jgi:hypothetical protein
MGVPSLTQAGAERSAALVAAEGYDIAVDLTDLPTGPQVRCVSTVTFSWACFDQPDPKAPHASHMHAAMRFIRTRPMGASLGAAGARTGGPAMQYRGG